MIEDYSWLYISHFSLLQMGIIFPNTQFFTLMFSFLSPAAPATFFSCVPRYHDQILKFFKSIAVIFGLLTITHLWKYASCSLSFLCDYSILTVTVVCVISLGASGVTIMFSSPIFPRFLLARHLSCWQLMELLFTSCAYDPTEKKQ